MRAKISLRKKNYQTKKSSIDPKNKFSGGITFVPFITLPHRFFLHGKRQRSPLERPFRSFLSYTLVGNWIITIISGKSLEILTFFDTRKLMENFLDTLEVYMIDIWLCCEYLCEKNQGMVNLWSQYTYIHTLHIYNLSHIQSPHDGRCFPFRSHLPGE